MFLSNVELTICVVYSLPHSLSTASKHRLLRIILSVALANTRASGKAAGALHSRHFYRQQQLQHTHRPRQSIVTLYYPSGGTEREIRPPFLWCFLCAVKSNIRYSNLTYSFSSEESSNCRKCINDTGKFTDIPSGHLRTEFAMLVRA